MSRMPDVRDDRRHVWVRSDHGNGVREGKLMTALSRRPPASITTFRDWNTVTALAAMLDE